MFANDDLLAGQLDAAGKASGDKLWRFPIGPAYDKNPEIFKADGTADYQGDKGCKS